MPEFVLGRIMHEGVAFRFRLSIISIEMRLTADLLGRFERPCFTRRIWSSYIRAIFLLRCFRPSLLWHFIWLCWVLYIQYRGFFRLKVHFDFSGCWSYVFYIYLSPCQLTLLTTDNRIPYAPIKNCRKFINVCCLFCISKIITRQTCTLLSVSALLCRFNDYLAFVAFTYWSYLVHFSCIR